MSSQNAPIFTGDANLEYLRLHVQALQRVLIRKGLVSYAEVLEEVHRLEATGHELGARVVARAWTDPAFKERLLHDGKAACAELG
ncbi:MAG TPA: nitrile hydratase subunit alpha, partial [Chloroflexota bacterium]|nr:nitrile hydratase subunit alpha [Chloroflexota bacterium]